VAIFDFSLGRGDSDRLERESLYLASCFYYHFDFKDLIVFFLFANSKIRY